jgi:hypothetical protein
MELFLGFVIVVAVYILLTYILYNAWVSLFEEVSETVTKGMKIVCIILGMLWPLTLLIIIPVTLIVLFNEVLSK